MDDRHADAGIPPHGNPAGGDAVGAPARRGDGVVFIHGGVEYDLASHPYEPCLHIRRDGGIIRVLHNAFEVSEIHRMLGGGGTLHGIDGRDYDGAALCGAPAAAPADRRWKMSFSFAADLAGKAGLLSR